MSVSFSTYAQDTLLLLFFFYFFFNPFYMFSAVDWVLKIKNQLSLIGFIEEEFIQDNHARQGKRPFFMRNKKHEVPSLYEMSVKSMTVIKMDGL